MKPTVWLLAVCCLALPLAASADSAKNLQPGESIQVVSKPDADLSKPGSSAWRDVSQHNLELTLAPPVHPSITLRYDASRPPAQVTLQAASDSKRLFVRLRWPDESMNSLSGRTEFADAVAVQFPISIDASTSFMMGGEKQPVNIWYWKAGGDGAQNLAAGGFGSTTPIATNGLTVSEDYTNGSWTVVFSRSLESQGEYQAQLGMGSQMALALWQGQDNQRDGLKHVTMGWINLNFTQGK